MNYAKEQVKTRFWRKLCISGGNRGKDTDRQELGEFKKLVGLAAFWGTLKKGIYILSISRNNWRFFSREIIRLSWHSEKSTGTG